jgi:hypothetical protein
MGAHEPAQMPQLTQSAGSTRATGVARPSFRGSMLIAP